MSGTRRKRPLHHLLAEQSAERRSFSGLHDRLAHKDLGIALDVANQLHVPMPLGAASREVYNQARAAGRGREDWTAILEQVRASAGLKKHTDK
jgi:3-hydroxyisobutyrate dehydrogenase-like beta-hydroxyacid dehydrogenase